ncbi:NAD(P)/FAD-dependent oxidoreductase [Candidatus Gottesmanbacteria bacterium]|nr:NAD(P)/FAD-dependent oxidoreductase [Candidatus Gottesmanbacteria bacterium]
MKIAIIGGGFTGLTAAYELTKRGHEVSLFEKDKTLGGLAHGFKLPNWNWSLEKAYHHLFTNDDVILSLIKELSLSDKLIIKRPITANYWDGQIYPFDSPQNLLSFPGLPMIDKLRTAVFLAALKVTPFWQPLESVTAEQLFVSIGGKRAWETIWRSLMIGKFGDYADSVAASWLWARIKKRTPNLCYIEGGFQTLVDRLSKAIRDHEGTIYTNTSISSMEKGARGQYYVLWEKQKQRFDRILLTIPTPIALKLIPNWKLEIGNWKLLSIPHLHAQTLILETLEPLLKGVYWLNILDRSFPFLAVVAHTNFMDPKHYGGHYLTYFGNYLPEGHPYLSLTAEQLLKKFLPYINKLTSINSEFRIQSSESMKKKSKFIILNTKLFVGLFAQPIHELHYSQKIPPISTPIPGIYLANMDYIYPWDRGTNYAVELGLRAAQALLR